MKSALCLMAAVVLLASCSKEPEVAAPPPPKATGPRKAPPKNFTTSWQTESQYIVEAIAADLAEMAFLASRNQLPTPGAITVESTENKTKTDPVLVSRVTLKLGDDTIACELPMTTPIWAPATYRPLVAALSEKFPLTRGNSPASGDSSPLLRALTNPTPEVLAQTDVTLSALLAKEFTSAQRHEEAALLLGAFALREASGKFYQIRGELCRMTAHLAFARQLDAAGAPSPAGRLAEATLTVLYNNQADALTQLESVPDSDETTIWKRALRMRATTDYRIIGQSDKPTLFETREWFQARAVAVSADLAWRDLNLYEEQKALSDWARIAHAEGHSVGLGHALLEISLPQEFQECSLVFAEEQGRPLDGAGLVEALNARPARFASPANEGATVQRIIGWGRWAAFLQRHLCHTIHTNFDFIDNMWGVPEESAKFRQETDKVFWGLRLYPFVRRLNAGDEAYYRAAQEEEMAFIHRAPEEVPAEAWNHICYNVRFCALYIPPPHAYVNEWHRYNPPPGTAYNPLPRMNHPSLTHQSDARARLEHLHQLAPYDSVITVNFLDFHFGNKRWTPAEVTAAYQPVLDYSPRPCARIARLSALNPVEFEKWMTKAAVLDPHGFLELAQFYEGAGQDSQAAEAYQRWLANETNAIAIANYCGFLIEYLERTGQPAAAAALADRAAETYAQYGLQAKGQLLERRGDFAGALDIYQKIRERYDEGGYLIGCLERAQKAKPDKEYAALREALMREYLPGGLRPVASPAPTSPPKRGVLVHSENDALEEAGLQKGDIVVAARGYQVENWRAFKTIRRLEPGVPYAMRIWRKGAYLDLKPVSDKHRFGIDLLDYKAP